MQYIVTVEYDSPFGVQRADLVIVGSRDIRGTLVKLSQVDLRAHIEAQTKEDPETVGRITVVSVASEEPVELPNGDTLAVFAMNLKYNEEANHGTD